MKTLQELIAGVRDCEAQGEAWTDKNKGCFATNASNRYEGFRSGHRAACDVLVPALELKRAMDKSTIEDLESRLEEATRLLERAKSLFLHELNINVDKWLSDLEAFNKGGTK